MKKRYKEACLLSRSLCNLVSLLASIKTSLPVLFSMLTSDQSIISQSEVLYQFVSQSFCIIRQSEFLYQSVSQSVRRSFASNIFSSFQLSFFLTMDSHVQSQILSPKPTNRPAEWTHFIRLEVDITKLLALAFLCKAFNMPVLKPTTTILTVLLSLPNTAKKYVQTINGVPTDIDGWIIKPYFFKINKCKRKRQKKAERKKA